MTFEQTRYGRPTGASGFTQWWKLHAWSVGVYVVLVMAVSIAAQGAGLILLAVAFAFVPTALLISGIAMTAMRSRFAARTAPGSRPGLAHVIGALGAGLIVYTPVWVNEAAGRSSMLGDSGPWILPAPAAYCAVAVRSLVRAQRGEAA